MLQPTKPKESIMTLIKNPDQKLESSSTTSQVASHLEDTIDGVSVFKCVGTASSSVGSEFRRVMDDSGNPALDSNGNPQYEAAPSNKE